MLINLYQLDIDKLFSGRSQAIIYGDFYVLNYLFKENLLLGEEITIYPDSTAVYFLLKYFYHYKVRKLVSTDLQDDILKKAARLNKKIFFFGDSMEILKMISEIICTKYPGVIIAGLQNGYVFNDKAVISKINASGADLLFVGLGATRQERWISDNLLNINIPVVISVGGWFQYLSGNKKRAPRFIRNINLEWVHKLFNDFTNVWSRYFLVLPVFIIRIISGKIKLKLNL